MNHIRVKWLWLFLAAPAFTARAEGPGVVDLVFETVDLEFHVENLAGDVQTLAGDVQTLAVSETATEVRIDLAADVLFAFDSAEIQSSAEEALGRAADVIKEYGDTRVRIDGHTDARGEEAYNLRLSEQRANAVRDWFVARAGVNRSRFETRGFGEANPVAPNANADGSDNPQGRQQNRRVEIRVQKE